MTDSAGPFSFLPPLPGALFGHCIGTWTLKEMGSASSLPLEEVPGDGKTHGAPHSFSTSSCMNGTWGDWRQGLSQSLLQALDEESSENTCVWSSAWWFWPMRTYWSVRSSGTPPSFGNSPFGINDTSLMDTVWSLSIGNPVVFWDFNSFQQNFFLFTCPSAKNT